MKNNMKEPMKCEREVEQNGAGDIELCGGELEEKGKFQTGEVVITEKNVYYPTETTIYQCKSCKDVTIK